MCEENKELNILNPLNDLITEKQTEIIDLENKFIDDDVLLNNILLSETVSDDFEYYQLLYIKDNNYILFNISENNETTELSKYNTEETPEELTKDNSTYRLISSDIAKKLNSFSKSESAFNIADEITEKLIISLKQLTQEQNKTNLKNCEENIKQIIREYSDKISDKINDKLAEEILNKLSKGTEPSAKKLAMYINNRASFFLDKTTRQRFMKTNKGFKEINVMDICKFFNDEFGFNEISERRANQVLNFITREVKRDYNLIEFTNGTLNTKTEEFYENVFNNKVLPKTQLPFKYTVNAENEYKQTKLYEEVHRTVKSEKWEWNESLFYKMFGSCSTATNEQELMTVFLGDSGTGKSTLLSIFKRCFSYSNVTLQNITKNERFSLYSCIGKDINIDDDIQSFKLDNIGALNSFVSGSGVEVEIKGENERAKLTKETTPRIVCASNKLPAVFGDGFKRRICLILCDNVLPDDVNKLYINRIENGERDEEIGLLYSYSIQEYFKVRNTAVITKKQKEMMLREWELKSYPAKICAEVRFIDTNSLENILYDLYNKGVVVDYHEEKYYITVHLKNRTSFNVKKFIPVSEVNKMFKETFRYARLKGKIFEEQAKRLPSSTVIKSAMESQGYYQSTKREENSTIKIYNDCVDVDELGFLSEIEGWKDRLEKV